jgi:hypothetical protein
MYSSIAAGYARFIGGIRECIPTQRHRPAGESCLDLTNIVEQCRYIDINVALCPVFGGNRYFDHAETRLM